MTLTNLTLNGDLDAQHPADAAPFPIRSCLHLYGTATATVGGGNTFACALINNSAAEPSTAGIVTVLTADVAITDNAIGVTSSVNNQEIRLVGIQDGSRQDLHLGSSRLLIERNKISLRVLGGEAIGVRLTGAPVDMPPPGDAALVDDNDIASSQSSNNAGIVVQSASAIVAFNSVHAAACIDSCSQAFATGIYAMNLRATDRLSILANTFSANYASYQDSASAIPAIVERDAVVGTILIDAIVDNVFGWEQPTETPALLVVMPGTDSTLDSPRGYGVYTEMTVNGNTGAATASNNVPQSPVYCPDNIHGDPTGPQHGAAGDIVAGNLSGDGSKAVTIADIDDTPRSFPTSDAGADVITACP